MKTPPLHKGSVIAVTVLFMSFLLIGIVGAAYLLSSHLRVTSLSADYLQATYNAESALELSLYELKHHREGYERSPLAIAWDPTAPLDNGFISTIAYRIMDGQPIEVPLEGGIQKFALYYELEDGTLRNIKDMQGLQVRLQGKTTQATASQDCLQVRLSGRYTQQGKDVFESITANAPCNQNIDLKSLEDTNPRTESLPLGQPYPFAQFLRNHEEVILLVQDTSTQGNTLLDLQVQGVTTSATLAHPKKKIVTEGTSGGSIIRKTIEIYQDQLPTLLTNSLVQ